MAKLKHHENDGSQAINAQVGEPWGTNTMTGSFPELPGIFVQLENICGFNVVRRIAETDNIQDAVSTIRQNFFHSNELSDSVWYLAAPCSTESERSMVAGTLRRWYSLPANK